ncbi:MAG: hypothetical protein ACI83D_000595 [Planctomycetota bacterium]|jgi:hypothetical protein
MVNKKKKKLLMIIITGMLVALAMFSADFFSINPSSSLDEVEKVANVSSLFGVTHMIVNGETIQLGYQKFTELEKNAVWAFTIQGQILEHESFFRRFVNKLDSSTLVEYPHASHREVALVNEESRLFPISGTNAVYDSLVCCQQHLDQYAAATLAKSQLLLDEFIELTRNRALMFAESAMAYSFFAKALPSDPGGGHLQIIMTGKNVEVSLLIAPDRVILVSDTLFLIPDMNPVTF